MFDEHVNMDAHVKSICRSAHFHLRNISKIRSFLTESATVQLVHSLVTSRVDYCNSLLYGLPNSKIQKLQRIMNVACRIVCRIPKFVDVTPQLKELHWLPAEARILFKVLLITFKAIHHKAPEYIQDLVIPYVPGRDGLRSESLMHIDMGARTNTKTYGDRSFQAAAAKEWNRLPLKLKECQTVDSFKINLKTFLFEKFYN